MMAILASVFENKTCTRGRSPGRAPTVENTCFKIREFAFKICHLLCGLHINRHNEKVYENALEVEHILSKKILLKYDNLICCR